MGERAPNPAWAAWVSGTSLGGCNRSDIFVCLDSGGNREILA